MMLTKMERAHEKESPGEPFEKPPLPTLAKLLEEAGLAAARHFGDGQSRYEVGGPQSPHHDHMICVTCGLILEFENEEIEQLQDSVAKRP